MPSFYTDFDPPLFQFLFISSYDCVLNNDDFMHINVIVITIYINRILNYFFEFYVNLKVINTAT